MFRAGMQLNFRVETQFLLLYYEKKAPIVIDA